MNIDHVKNTPGTFIESEKKFSLREIFFKYLSQLPLFLLSIAVSVGIGTLYLRYTVPLYKAQANMLVRTSDDNNVTSSTASSSASNDLVSNAVFGGRRINLDNEIERLRANSFLTRVVVENKANIKYYDRGNIKKSNVYKSCPILVEPLFIKDSSIQYNWYFFDLNKYGGKISLQSKESTDTSKYVIFKWGDSLKISGSLIYLSKRYALDSAVSTKKYLVTWQPVNSAANALRSSLIITPLNAKATIIQLAIKGENAEEGKNILNSIIKEYRKLNVEEKNKVARNTIKFIDDRLNVVIGELTQLTSEIQNYKDSNKILDIPKQFGFYLDNSLGNLKTIDNLDLNLDILKLLEDYLKRSDKKETVIISPLSLNDPTLLQLIAGYNQLLLKKQTDQLQVKPDKSDNIESLDYQLTNIKQKLFENIAVIRSLYISQKEDFKSKNNRYQTYLSTLPHQDIHINELVRQQNIKQQLYSYLLNKKEETEIASASTVSDYQQLEFAEASSRPVEPQSGNIRLFSFIVGFLFPIGVIYVMDLLNDTIITKDDITKRTRLPITGEISHLDRDINYIVVGQSRNMIAEQFRILRSNLQFLLKEQASCKTFLITSSLSGEGKSFTSLNLASVISLSGKKVALLEFDLRKMRSVVYVGEKQNGKGITNYLIGQTNNPADLITTIDKFPDLDIYRSGPIPPNPAELGMSEKVEDLFKWLKERYDYIVIDSAPVGLVSDSFALVKYSDTVLYVVRQRYTFKKQIDFVDELSRLEKLKNVSLVVNDVYMGGKYGYYGYSYGYGYGYVYRYGFGYKYGYGYGSYAGKYFKKGAEGYFDIPGKSKK